MKQIRRNVFETNSSSTHSLVVTKTDSQYHEIEHCYVEGGVLDFYWRDSDLYFGRYPFQILNSFEKKLAYIISTNCGRIYNENKTKEQELKIKALMEIVNVVQKRYPQINRIKLPTKYKNEEDYYGGNESYFNMSYFDKNNISLEEFLFNSKYIIIVDGDEYCVYEDMIESGLINKDNIILEINF